MKRLAAPSGPGALVIRVEPGDTIDFRGIADQRIVIVRAGDRLIILFEDDRSIVLQGFFGPDGEPTSGVAFVAGDQGPISTSRFAELFPLSNDPSILPASGPASANPSSSSPFLTDPRFESRRGPSFEPSELLRNERFGSERDRFGAPEDDSDGPLSTIAPSAFGSAISIREADTVVAGSETGGVFVVNGKLDYNFGTEGAGGNAIRFDTGGLPAMTADGLPVTYRWEAASNTFFAETPKGPVFTLRITDPAAGTYEASLFGNVDHSGANGAGILLTLPFTVTSALGNVASSTFALTLTDDAPSAGAAQAGAVVEAADGTFIPSVANGALNLRWGADNADDTDGIDNSTVPGSNRSLAFAGSNSSGTAATAGGAPLMSNGVAVILSTGFEANGNPVLTGRAGERTVFRLVLNDDGTGSYRFELLGNLDHTGAGNDALTLDFGVRASDSDGDAVDTRISIVVRDSVATPSIGEPESADIDEDGGLKGSLAGGKGDHPDALATARGLLNINWGADDALPGEEGEAPATRLLRFSDETLSQLKEMGLASRDVPLDFAIDGSGTVLTAFAGDSTVFVVTLSAAGEGAFSFELLAPLDHGDPETEDEIDFSFGFIATDSDGDTVEGSFDISVDDDSPITKTNPAATLDDDALVGGNAGGVGDWTPTPAAGEFRVNPTVAGSQSYPSVAVLRDGNTVVTWGSFGEDGSGWGVYGQIYDAEGALLGAPFRLNQNTAQDQQHGDLVALRGGGFVATWSSSAQDGSGSGIFARQFDPNGFPVGDEFRVNSYTPNDQSFASMASLTDGGFVIGWTSLDQDGAGWGFYGQRFSAAGIPAGSEFKLSSFNSTHTTYSSLAGLPDGGFLAVWESYAENITHNGLTDFGIFGRRYDNLGNPGDVFSLINEDININQGSTNITVLTDGRVIVAWSAYVEPFPNADIFAQMFDSNGAKIGVEFKLNTVTNAIQFWPSIAALPDGGFVASWVTNGHFNSNDIVGQRFDRLGRPIGSEFSINETLSGWQTYNNTRSGSGLAVLDNGDVIATWEGNGTGDDYGIFARRFSISYAGPVSGNAGGVGDADPDATNITGRLGHGMGADGGRVGWLTSGAPDGFSYALDGTTLQVLQGDTVVLTLTLDAATGDYTIRQNAPIRHAEGQDENDQAFRFAYRVTDGDGDTADGALDLTVNDDTPVSGQTALLELYDAIRLDPDENFLSGPLPINATFGADGGVLSWLATGAPDGFSYEINASDPLSLDVYQHDAETGEPADVPVLVVTIDPATGSYNVLQNAAIRHPDGQGINEQAFTFAFRATDGDRDIADGTISVTIVDDIPEIEGVNATVTLDDDALANGNAAGEGDRAPDAANATGTLSHGFGGDGGSIGWLTTGAPQGFSYALNGTALEVRQGTTLVLSLSLDPATGAYSATQHAAIAHPAGSEENDTNFTFAYRVTDKDGDTVDGTLDLTVNDDTPVWSGIASGWVFHEAHVNDGGDIGTLFATFNGQGNLASAQLKLADLVNFGADGMGNFALTADALPWVQSLGLTSQGEAVSTVAYQASNLFFAKTASGRSVFSISLDVDSGRINFTLHDGFDQREGADSTDFDVSSLVSIKDTDGDAFVLPPGSAYFRITDDGVIARSDSASGNEDSSALTINLLANDFGADLAKSVEITNIVYAPGATSATGDGGTYTLDPATGVLRFTPAANWNGTATFTYRVTDHDGDSAEATASFNIAAVNDAPVLAVVPAPASISELVDASAQDIAPVTGSLSVTDVDVGNALTASVSGSPSLQWSGGSLSGSQLSSLTSALATGRLTFTGAVSNGGVQTLGYSWDPSATNLDFLAQGQTLRVNYQVRVSDGVTTTGTQPLTFTIVGTNDAPTANNFQLVTNVTGNTGFSTGFTGWTILPGPQTGPNGERITSDYTYSARIDTTQSLIPGDVTVAELSFGGWLNRSGDGPLIGTAYGPSLISDTFTGRAGDLVKFEYRAFSGGDAASITAQLINTATNAIIPVFFEQTPAGVTGPVKQVSIPLAADGNYKIEFKIGSFDASDGGFIGARLAIGTAGIVRQGVDDGSPQTFEALQFLNAAADKDSGAVLTLASVDAISALGASVSINAAGNVVYSAQGAGIAALAFGETATDTFRYTIIDQFGASATATASILVTGRNDAPTLGTLAALTFGDTSADDTFITAIGQLAGEDVDGDTLTYGITGGTATSTMVDGVTYTRFINGTYGRLLVVDSGADAGKYRYEPNDAAIEALKAGASESFTFTASDGMAVASTVLTINLTGANDTPSFSGVDIGSVTEDVTLTATGTLGVADRDTGDSVFQPQSGLAGSYGTLSINAAGAWSYALTTTNVAVQALGVGQTLADSFTVRSADNTPTSVTITITGTNDVPVFSGTSTGAVTEDVAIAVSGTLTATDADAGQSAFQPQTGIAGTFGTLDIDATGAWTYTLDNALASVQALGVGETLSDLITVRSVDNTAAQIAITINGANDAPTLQAVAALSYADTSADDTFAVGTGRLVAADIDGGTLTFGIQGGVATNTIFGAITYTTLKTGTYGTLLVVASGPDAGKYRFEPNDAAIEALKAGASENFTFTVSDGTATTTTTLTVNLTGANDTPEFVLGTPHFSGLEDGGTGNGTFVTSDRDGDVVTVSVATQGALGTATVTGPGTFSYAPNAHASGQDSFTLAFTDGATGGSRNVTVDLAPVADAPVVAITQPVALLAHNKLVGAQVAVFDNGNFVDTNNDFASESDTIQASLRALGHNVSTFTGIDSGSLAGALAGKRVLVVPELEYNALQLSAEATNVLRQFVQNGGTLVISGQSEDRDEAFLNATFGFNLQSHPRTYLGYDGTAARDGTTFADDGSSVGSVTAVYGVRTNSLPDGTLGLYQKGSETVVAAMPYGSGQIISLGFDWYNATPMGPANGGWLNLLDSAISAVSIGSQPVGAGLSGNEDTPISIGMISATSPDPSETVALMLSGFPAGGTFSVGTANGDGTWSIPANLVAGLATTPLSFTPPANWNGTFTLSVTATSTDTATLSTGVSTSTASTTKTLDVTVKAVNDAPSLEAVEALAYADTSANDTFVGSTGQLAAADIDGGTLTFGIQGGVATNTIFGAITYTTLKTGTYGTLLVVASGADAGKYRFEPHDAAIEALKSGASESFTFTVSDGTATTTTTLTVNLTGANDTPEFVLGTPHFSGLEDGGNGNGTFVTSDRDGDAVTVSVATQGALGTATVTGPGTFSYAPNAHASGQDSFTLAFTDGATGGSRNVTVDLAPVADAPVVVLGATGSVTPMPVAGEFLVNSTTFQSQAYQSVATLKDGKSVVMWASFGEDGSGWGLFGRLYDAAGAPVGTPFQINQSTDGHQYPSDLSALSGGGFVAVWTDEGRGDVVARRFDAHGTALGDEFRVNSTVEQVQTFSDVTALADGGFVIAWGSFAQDGSGWGVYGQRFNAAGAPTGAEFRINDYTNADQDIPALAGLPNGGFVAVWQSAGQDGMDRGVFGRIYDNAGTPGVEFGPINTFTISNQSTPEVIVTSDGGFVVAWSSQSQIGEGYEVYAQIFSASGTKVGNEFRLNEHTALDQISPALLALPDGGFVASWSSLGQDSSNWGFFGRRFDAAGNPTTPDVRFNETESGLQFSDVQLGGNPLALLPSGDIIATWYGQGAGDSSGQGVFARRFEMGFSPTGNEDSPISLGKMSATSPDPSETVALTLSGFPAGGTFSVGTANGDGTWSIPTNLVAGLATTPLAFTPPANWNGTFTLSVTATSTDTATLSTGVSTSTASTTKTLDVTVKAVNDAPTLQAVEALAYADTSANDTFVGSTGQLAAADIDGGTLTFGIQGGVATNTIFGAITYTTLKTGTYGTLLVVASGPDAGKYRFEPNDAAIEALKAGASESFSFTVSDGTATTTTTLTVNLTGANDAPEFVLGTPHFSGLEDGGNGNGTFVTSDRDGDVVTVSVATQGALGTATVTGPGTFSYAPNAHASGQDSFTLAYTDGATGGSRNVTVDLAPVADTPVLVLSAATKAPTPVSGEFRVNTYTADAQLYPAVAVLKDGKSVIMWASVYEDGHGWGMYGQTYDAGGAPLGAPFRFNQTTAYNQFWGDIAALPDGGFVATWANYRTTDVNGNYIYDIVTRRYDANAAPVGNEIFITDSASYTRHYGDIAVLADGGYVIVWSSLGQDGYDYGIYGQRFNAAGTKAGSEFRLNSYTTDTQWFSSVAALPDGGFVAVWESTGQDGDSYGVFGRLYDAAGNAGAEFGPINSTTVDSQRYSDVVSLIDGRFVVAWSGFDQSGSAWNIFAQIFDDSGTRVGNEFRVNTYVADHQWMPTLVALPDGGFIASWSSEGQEGSEGQDGSSAGVFGQRFDADGKPVGTEFRLNETIAGRQDNSPLHAGNTMVILPNGDLLAAWDGSGNGDNTGVFARRFSLSYGTEGTEDSSISLGTMSATSPDTSETVALVLSGFPAGGTFSVGTANPDGTWSIPANLVAGLATTPLSFTPPANWNGTFTLSVTATSTDTATLSTGVSTSTATTTKTLDVTVKAVNDAPTLQAVEALSYADTSADDTFVGSTGQLAAADIDGGTLTFGIQGGVATNTIFGAITYTTLKTGTYGTLLVVASGPDAGKYRYEPNDAAIEALKAGASENFTFTVSDGSATTTTTLTVNLSGANDTPEFVLGTPHFSGLEDGGNGNGTFVTSDRDGDVVTVSVATQGALGTATVTGPGTFSYAPNAHASGQDSFTLAFTDGSAGGSRNVTVDLAPVADAPVVVLEAAGVGTPTPLGVEALVNTFTSNGQNAFSGDGQTYPSVLSLPSGGYVVAWSSVSHPGDGNWRSVHFQRFDAAGNKLGAETQMNTFTTDQQDVPSLAAIPNGGFVAVWQSAGDQDGSGYGIFARRYDANGTAIDAAEFRVNTYTTSNQLEPTVVSLADGGFVVAWHSPHDANGWGIFAQRFNSAGQRVGVETQINLATSGTQAYPSISATPDGGFNVAWASNTADGSGFGVIVRSFDANGAPIGSDVLVNSATANDQTQPVIGVLEDGKFVVSWQSGNQDGSAEGVYAQLFQADGTRLGTETRVTTHTANEQRYPGVTALPDGGYLIVWSSWAQDGDNWGQYAQRFDALGNKLGDEFRINQTTTGEQSAGYPPNGGYPLATLTNGDVVAVTQGNGPGDNFGIFARRFSLKYSPEGNEDSSISLGKMSATSPDPSETVALTLSGFPAGGTFSVGTANPDGTWSIPANLVAGLATTPLTFTPPANWNGTFTLSVTAVSTDTATLSTGVSTSTASTTKTLDVTVKAVNDAPTAVADSLSSVPEDSAKRIISFASLLGNDFAGPSNESGQTMTITAVSNAVGGTVVINGTNVEFTPTPNFNGVASFDYTMQDNGQTGGANDFKSAVGRASFTITSVPDAPVGTASTLSLTEDVARALTAADFGFTDPLDTPSNNFTGVLITTLPGAGVLTRDGAVLSAGTVVSLADINAGKLVYTPGANGNGASYASFTFQVQDDGISPSNGIVANFGAADLAVSGLTADVPNPSFGYVALDQANTQLDFFALGSTNMWFDRANVPIVSAVSPIVGQDQTWSVQTQVHLNNASASTTQVAGLTFYNGLSTSLPAFTFGFDTWGAKIVHLQGIGSNTPTISQGVSGSDLYLKVDVTEKGAADSYTFSYKTSAGAAWTLLAANLVLSADNSRVGMFYKTGSSAAGASFNQFEISVPEPVGENTDTTPRTMTFDVTAVNDAAAFGGVLNGSVTEDGTLTASGTATVTDPDAGEAAFQPQTNFASTYGTLSINAAGAWTYTLDNSLASVQALNAGQTLTDTITVRSVDNTATNIAITINGADENTAPVFRTVADQIAGQGFIRNSSNGNYYKAVSGAFTFAQAIAGADALKGHLVAIGDTAENGFVRNLASSSGLQVAWIGLSDQRSEGSWRQLYGNAPLSFTNWLAGEPNDAGGNEDAAFMFVSNGGPPPGLWADDSDWRSVNVFGSLGYVVEVENSDTSFAAPAVFYADTSADDTFNPITGRLSAKDAEGDALTYGFTGTAGAGGTFDGVTYTHSQTGSFGTLYLVASGTDAGKYRFVPNDASIEAIASGTSTAAFGFTVSDGVFTTTANLGLNMVVTGANDPATISGQTTGSVTEDGVTSVSGSLTVVDRDASQSSFQAETGLAGTYGTLDIDTAGAWTYTLDNAHNSVQGLGAGQTLSDTLTVRSFDGTTRNIAITINGTNDRPTFTGTFAGSVTEDGTLTAGGVLTATDRDAGQSSFQAQTGIAGTYGTLNITAAGVWTYTLNNTAAQGLVTGQSVTDTITVRSADNDTTSISITVNGTNDAPTFAGQYSGSVTEDSVTSVSGTATVSDLDSGHAGFQAQTGIVGTYGTLNINTAGNWTYFLNNSLAVIQALNAGQTRNDSVTVRSIDGTTRSIAITINGANEVTNSFTWTTAGAATTTPNSAVINSDGAGENTDTQLQTFLGMSIPVDNAIAQDAYNGSAIKTTVSVGSSRYLKFTYSFTGADANTPPYYDTSFITINGATTILKQFPGAVSNVTFSRALTAGSNTIGFASVDVSDSQAGATLTLSNIRIGSAADPIILDLDRDGIRLTGEAVFDLDTNGEAERIGWAKAGDAVLVMDLDGSGKIENGNEVVADHFMGLGFGDSLDALAFLDGNLDGRVDLSDEAFARLRAWNDANGNGTTEEGELISLADLGITGIDVGAERVSRELDGHQVFGEGQVLYADGTTSAYLAVDFFEVSGGGQPNDAAFAPDTSGLDMRLAMAELENGAALSLGRA